MHHMVDRSQAVEDASRPKGNWMRFPSPGNGPGKQGQKGKCQRWEMVHILLSMDQTQKTQSSTAGRGRSEFQEEFLSRCCTPLERKADRQVLKWVHREQILPSYQAVFGGHCGQEFSTS